MSTLTIQISDSLKRQLDDFAAREGVSAADWARRLIERGLTESEQLTYLNRRGAAADIAQARRLMDRVPSAAVDPSDRID